MAGGERAVQRETLKAFGLSHWQVANPRLRVRHSGMALASQTSEKNMTNLNRRQALSRIGLASSAALVGGGLSLGTASAVEAHPDAHLLRLRGELDAAEARFFAAIDAEEQAFQRWQAIRPHPDAIIVAPREYRLRMVEYDGVADPRGKLMQLDDGRAMYVALPSSIRVTLASYDGRSMTAKWLRRMLIHAEQFWRAMDAADDESGAALAGMAQRQAWYDMDQLSTEAFASPAASLEGLAIMTRAAVLADLGRQACNGSAPDPRFATLARSIGAIVGRGA